MARILISLLLFFACVSVASAAALSYNTWPWPSLASLAALPRNVRPRALDASNTTAACEADLLALGEQTYPNALLMLLFATGKDLLSDLGGYDYCRALRNAHFGTLTGTLVLDSQPLGELIWGVCLPISCTGAAMDAVLAQDGALMPEVLRTRLALASSPRANAMPTVALLGGAVQFDDELEHRFANLSSSPQALAVLALLGLLACMVVLATGVEQMHACRSQRPHRAGVAVVPGKRAAVLPEHELLLAPLAAGASADSSRHVQGEIGGAADRARASVSDVLACWALERNTTKLLGTSPPLLRVLNGMRVLSMLWIIYGHTTLFLILVVPLNNPNALVGTAALASALTPGTANLYKGAVQHVDFQFVIGAEFAVDSFFFMSALLAAFTVLSSPRAVPWLHYYFHRWWRLTPVYGLILLVWIVLVPYLGSGPLWSATYAYIRKTCHSNWWANLLYVNAWVPHSYESMCAGWTWYLGCDMPLYALVLPPLLIAYRSAPWRGWALLALGLVASLVYSTVIVWHWSLNNYPIGADANPHYDYGTYYYSKPYTRFPPYAIGVALAFVLDTLARTGNVVLRLPRLARLAAYGVAAVLMLATSFGAYAQYSPLTPPSPYYGGFSKTTSIVYIVLSKLAWTVGLAILVYVFASGDGGLLARFLSARIWDPLARLTFSAYLVHPIIMFAVAASFKSTFTYSAGNVGAYFALFCALAYGCSAALFFLIEKPLQNLEPLLFGTARSSARE